MHYGNFAQEEAEVTGDMPIEPCSVLAFPQERNTAVLESAPVRGAFLAEDEEPTTVEFLKNTTAPSWLYLFLFSPHYKTAVSIEWRLYLRRVRDRIRQSRRNHRMLYPNSGFQKIRGFLERALRHAKKNLAVK
ncbi:MAG: hypothetical protein IT573_08305 [Deltaproteobacteria bacterium]|nr:hypothetical protein [Deltaproteobacteria bacterium]